MKANNYSPQNARDIQENMIWEKLGVRRTLQDRCCVSHGPIDRAAAFYVLRVLWEYILVPP